MRIDELPLLVSIDALREHLAAPSESSDPLEILARREIAIGINLQGMPVDVDVIVRVELKLDLNE